MILALSSSSAIASAALFSPEGQLVASGEREAPRAASGALIQLCEPWLQEHALSGIVADVGPGSFTGVKVAVMLAKTWGYLYQIPVGGIAAFDLISRDGVRVIPSRKGEFFVHDGHELTISPHASASEPPIAAHLAATWDRIQWSTALELEPNYIFPPSISQPKRAPGLLTP